MLRAVAPEVLGTTSVVLYGEHRVDLAQPFARLTITGSRYRHHPRTTKPRSRAANASCAN